MSFQRSISAFELPAVQHLPFFVFAVCTTVERGMFCWWEACKEDDDWGKDWLTEDELRDFIFSSGILALTWAWPAVLVGWTKMNWPWCCINSCDNVCSWARGCCSDSRRREIHSLTQHLAFLPLWLFVMPLHERGVVDLKELDVGVRHDPGIGKNPLPYQLVGPSDQCPMQHKFSTLSYRWGQQATQRCDDLLHVPVAVWPLCWTGVLS